LHHKNHKHSSSNHNNASHQKPDYPSNPVPQSAPKRSVLSRFKERFQEKPATEEEVKQLGLNAKREVYKTAIQKAKSARPSRFSAFSNGPSSGRGTRHQESGLFGGGGSGSWLMDSNSGPSFGFITGAEPQKGRRSKQDSGFGKGLTDLF